MKELRAVDAWQLRDLAAALQSGRLGLDPSEMALTAVVGRGSSDAGSLLAWFLSEGFSAAQAAGVLAMLAADRTATSSSLPDVQLVSTGPESSELPNRDTRVVVRELFSSAKESVLVAGYAVFQGRDVFGGLAESMDRTPELQVSMFLDVQRPHNDTSTSPDILTRFAHRFRNKEWPGRRVPAVYYDPRSLNLDAEKRTSLHAKCVVVDRREAFISSANFTEAAQMRNIEIGVLLGAPALARQLADHFLGLADRGILQRVPGL